MQRRRSYRSAYKEATATVVTASYNYLSILGTKLQNSPIITIKSPADPQ